MRFPYLKIRTKVGNVCRPCCKFGNNCVKSDSVATRLSTATAQQSSLVDYTQATFVPVVFKVSLSPQKGFNPEFIKASLLATAIRVKFILILHKWP